MCKLYLEEIYSNKSKFVILNTMKSSGVNKLVPRNIKFMVNIFRPLFYNNNKYKIIPDSILNSSYNIRLNFFIGYYAADGAKCYNSKNKNIRMCNKGKIGSAHLYYLMKSLGYKTSISIRNDKPNIYRLTSTINKQRKLPNILKKKEKIISNYEGYVYDLETNEGIFQAGIGEIIVKNTDSVFINFTDYIKQKYNINEYPEYYESNGKIKDKSLLKLTIKSGQDAGEYITSKLKKPQDLEYEKVFWPFIIFSKKRYVGNKYEFSDKKFKQTSMGIVLKRRDNAPIVKKVYGEIIDYILNKRDIEGSKKCFTKKCC